MDLTQRPSAENGDGMLHYRLTFAPQGAGVPTFAGKYVKSVVRTSAGVYTATFNSNFGALLGFVWGIRDITGGVLATATVMVDPIASSTTAAGGAQIVFRVCPVTTGASGTDYTCPAGTTIDVNLTFGNDPNNQS